MAGASGYAPPATFDLDEVRAVSRRVTKRRRTAAALAGAGAVLLLTGAVISGNIATTESADPAARQHGTESTQNSPGLAPKQGGNGSRGDGPSRADRTGRCDKVGWELVEALDDELPPTDDAPVPRCDPEGHAVAVRVDGGTVTAWLSERSPGDTAGDTPNQPPGAVSVVRRTSVGVLTVMSIPGEQKYGAPLSAQVPRIATAVANALQ